MNLLVFVTAKPHRLKSVLLEPLAMWVKLLPMLNRGNFVRLFILILVLAAVAWFNRSRSSSSPVKSAEASEAIQPRIGPHDIYPDPVRTPGATYPGITQENIRETICNPRWSTKSIRPDESYTHRLKIQQIREYGYSDTRLRDYEEDHFIPLNLGGNPTDPRNLWPEPYAASIPDGGVNAKDQVENYLHAEVCSGGLTLEQAQREIAEDWYRVYQASVPH